MKPAVARAALAAGASIVNDVAANRGDDAMWQIVSEFQAGYIVMHARQWDRHLACQSSWRGQTGWKPVPP